MGAHSELGRDQVTETSDKETLILEKTGCLEVRELCAGVGWASQHFPTLGQDPIPFKRMSYSPEAHGVTCSSV